MPLLVREDGAVAVVKPPAGDRIAVLDNVTLPDANGYTDPPAVDVPPGSEWAVFFMTYTSATALGGFKFKALGGNGTEEGPLPIVDSAVTPNPPFSQQTVRPGEFIGPVPGSGNTVTFPIQVRVSGLKTVRLVAAEVTATEGTFSLAMNFQ